MARLATRYNYVCYCMNLSLYSIGEEVINIPGVNPTFWLNHIFFTNPIQFDASVR